MSAPTVKFPPAPLNILECFTVEPPPLDFVWPGFLSGTVGALVAPGATGKSFFALEAGMAVACTVAGGDLLGVEPQAHGRVEYFSFEDPANVLKNRLHHAIGKYVIDPIARKSIAENMSIWPCMGSLVDIIDSKFRDEIVKIGEGSRLLIFDTFTRIHRLEENSNSDMSQVIASLENVAARTGAAILFLHHTGKSATANGKVDDPGAGRGASALVANARWTGFLQKMTIEEADELSDDPVSKKPVGTGRRNYFVRFGISKQNYGEAELDCWFRRQVGGALLPVDLVVAEKERKEEIKRDEVPVSAGSRIGGRRGRSAERYGEPDEHEMGGRYETKY